MSCFITLYVVLYTIHIFQKKQMFYFLKQFRSQVNASEKILYPGHFSVKGFLLPPILSPSIRR